MSRTRCGLRQRYRRRGAVLIIVAVMLAVILGVAALSVDAGNIYQERRKAQAAADAAADAAAVDLYTKYDANRGVDVDGQARATALEYATAHGYTDGPDNTVNVNIPPLAGAYAGKAGYV